MYILRPFSISFLLIFIAFWTTSCCFGDNCFWGNEKSVEKNVVLSGDEVVNSDYFAAGSSVTLSGLVKGDAYVAGGVINFDGTVDGDLIAAGGEVNIRGTILDDLRLSGGQIIISGEILGNLTVAGGSVTLTDSAKVGGSLVSAGGNINIFAPIGSDVTIGAGKLTIGNAVGGSVKAGAGEISLASNARIEGDLTYYSKNKAQIQKGAEIKGTVSHKIPDDVRPERMFGAGILLYLIFEVLSVLIVGLLVIKFYPNFINNTVEIIQKSSLTSLGVGLLGMITIPVAFIILMVTIIGIPLGIIILLSFFIYIYLSKIFVSIFLGRSFSKLLGGVPRDGWALLIGIIIFVLLTSIPFIGGLLYMLSIFLGLGALLIIKKKLYTKLKSEKVV